MSKYRHQFVENYRDIIGFGLNRETDQNTIIAYLQMFSDDRLANVMVERMSDDELEDMFNALTALLQRHLSEKEYHTLFLRDGD
jgi:TorA maturation chaperone TorD